MNVGELKAAIGDLPDEAVVVITYSVGYPAGARQIYYAVPKQATAALVEKRSKSLAIMADMMPYASFEHGCLLIAGFEIENNP